MKIVASMCYHSELKVVWKYYVSERKMNMLTLLPWKFMYINFKETVQSYMSDSQNL